jgi:HEAT repeat protein
MRGEQRLKPLMIIPTLEKNALTIPYIGLAMKFTDVLRETKLLIIAGNSLRDQHIKGYIRERLDSLHVLLVSPSAGKSRDVFDQPDRMHTLNAGFSEFLTFGADRLLQLGKEIASADLDSRFLGDAVQAFITEVSRDVEEDASLRSNPELYRLWMQLQGASVTARVAAVKGLSIHRHPAINTRLSSLLENDPDPPVRVAALDYLFNVLGTDSVPALGAALNRDPAQEVQMEAALALISMGTDGPTRPWLEQARGRQELRPVVRDIIQESLAKVGYSKPQRIDREVYGQVWAGELAKYETQVFLAIQGGFPHQCTHLRGGIGSWRHRN